MINGSRIGRVLVYGASWGLLATVLEWVTLPVRQSAWLDSMRLLWSIAPAWCLVGMGLTAWIEIAGARLLRPKFLVASTLVCAAILSALWSLSYHLGRAEPGSDAMHALFPHGVNALAAFLYQAWVITFYGGLYFFVWTLGYRAERTRALLAEAQIARLRAETLLGESRLEALRECIDPRFLLQVVGEAERRYADRPESADGLIAQLVSFLRLAMPGIRTGTSTLVTELRLAKAYAALREDLGAPNRCTIVSSPSLPDMPLPPLLVAALLDGISSSAQSAVRLEASVDGGRVLLRVSPPLPQDWLSEDRQYRVRVGLSMLYGSDWSFDPDAEAAMPILSLPASVRKFHRQEALHA